VCHVTGVQTCALPILDGSRFVAIVRTNSINAMPTMPTMPTILIVILINSIAAALREVAAPLEEDLLGVDLPGVILTHNLDCPFEIGRATCRERVARVV